MMNSPTVLSRSAIVTVLIAMSMPVLANQEMDRIRNKWVENSPDHRIAEKLNNVASATEGASSDEAVKSGKSMFDKMVATGQNMPEWMFESLLSGTQQEPSQAKQRDPFALTPQTFLGVSKVAQAMEFMRHNQSTSDTLVVPTTRRITAKDLPMMTLKGVADRGAGDLAALLKIDGIGVRVVRTGDTIGLQAVGKDTAIQVIKVDHHQIIVEAGDLKTAIVVQ